MVSPTFYNRKSYGRLLKVINLQPHISIGFKGGDANLYGYVEENPINLTDPTGLSTLSDLKAWYCKPSHQAEISMGIDACAMAGYYTGTVFVVVGATGASVANLVGNTFICKEVSQSALDRIKQVLSSKSTWTTLLGAAGPGKATKAGEAIYGFTMALFDSIFSYEKGAFEASEGW